MPGLRQSLTSRSSPPTVSQSSRKCCRRREPNHSLPFLPCGSTRHLKRLKPGLQRNSYQHFHRNRLVVELRRPEHPLAPSLGLPEVARTQETWLTLFDFDNKQCRHLQTSQSIATLVKTCTQPAPVKLVGGKILKHFYFFGRPLLSTYCLSGLKRSLMYEAAPAKQ